ncbi:MAG: Do family serine endopeptidase [Nevskia sp.]|nr:Do family serine endopeptidase [Nevskia sp.]
MNRSFSIFKPKTRPLGLSGSLGLITLLLSGSLVPICADDLKLPPTSKAQSTSLYAAPSDTALIKFTSAPDYRAIVERYGPAVVSIAIESDNQANGLNDPNATDGPSTPGFRTFPLPDDPKKPMWGLGSGFIISSDGVVLTNSHVVRDASSVTVTLYNRREYIAKVLGLDPATDIAVLKIDASDLPTIRLGDSGALKVGDYVLAIGTPFGFDQTATSGIVSAVRRPLPDAPYIPFIQTDAAVNPGNSGGPLFNAHGEVIGINAQIYSRTGAYEGLSFAIPINLAKHIAGQILASGKVEHARLGVTVQQLTQPLAESFGLKRPDGALISDVAPHSAASLAGLRAGDVILKCNSEPIRVAGEVSALVGVANPSEAMTFFIWRKNAGREINVKLGQAMPTTVNVDASDAFSNGKLGLILKSPSSDEKMQVNISSGLVVMHVSGPSERAGILAGDLLLSVNGTPVGDAEQLESIVPEGAETVALLIQRGGIRTYIAVLLK